ncbi:hypothetical protein, partial [Allokutzneria sp. NRRL B-24872]|uniref:hypothetical protein n=1 Tax=Allokutzneria sp. NRRL B-24872 TaxID=1137961 RepID=UPI001AEFA256
AWWDGSEEGWGQFRDWVYIGANEQDPRMYAEAYQRLEPLGASPLTERIEALRALGFTVTGVQAAEASDDGGEEKEKETEYVPPGLRSREQRDARRREREEQPLSDLERRAQERRRATQEWREGVYRPYRRSFASLREGRIVFERAASNHESELDPGLDPVAVIRSVDLHLVEFGRGRGPDSVQFMIVLPPYRGRSQGYLIGEMRENDLSVFHIGPTGGGRWSSLLEEPHENRPG